MTVNNLSLLERVVLLCNAVGLVLIGALLGGLWAGLLGGVGFLDLSVLLDDWPGLKTSALIGGWGLVLLGVLVAIVGWQA